MRLNKKRLSFFISVILLLFCLLPAHSQYTIQWPDKQDITAVRFIDPNKNNGFIASVSLIALFTTGTQDRNGFRTGLGFNLAYRVNYWHLFSGLTFYKANKERFGIGTVHAGSSFFNGNIGGSYLVNRYIQGARQTSAMIGFRTKDFEFRFENDFLAIPFTGFKRYDRFRTAAAELRYKNFLLGTNVFTTDTDGVTDFSYVNKKGTFRQGRQLSSPVYVGYTDKGVLVRYGISNHLGGFCGQNGWHRYLFSTPDFKNVTHKTHFLQIGTNQPNTLY